MDKVRTAVVGVGHQGKWHAEKFAALADSHLVAVVDKDADRCKILAAELNAEPVSDFRDLIGAVDAVSIASPTRSHFDIASALLENDIHVLVENTIGLRRGGFDKQRYRAVETAFRALRDGNKELNGVPDTDDVMHLREWLAAKSKYGIYGFAHN